MKTYFLLAFLLGGICLSCNAPQQNKQNTDLTKMQENIGMVIHTWYVCRCEETVAAQVGELIEMAQPIVKGLVAAARNESEGLRKLLGELLAEVYKDCRRAAPQSSPQPYPLQAGCRGYN